jgi:hypothetical protein
MQRTGFVDMAAIDPGAEVCNRKGAKGVKKR